MKTILKITALSATLLMFVGSFVSCKKKESNEIPFTEYSLGGTDCQWVLLQNVLRIINSNEELEKFVRCWENDSYPTIDFSKQTLLQVGGNTGAHRVMSIKKKLQKTSAQSYILNVILDLRVVPTGMHSWSVAIITDKIAYDANIGLTITKNIQP